MGILTALILVGLYYYVALPAVNFQETGIWMVLIAVLGVLTAWAALRGMGQKTKLFSLFSALLVLVIVVFLGGMILSSQLISSKKYAGRLKVENKKFETDMKETEKITDIALMDTEGARIIGDRAIGSLSDVVSQYEVSDDYTQIDYNGQPMKVAPLNYASFIRYMTNRKAGIPGYVQVDPISNEAKYVKLKKPMQYSTSAYFSRNLQRHLRFQYPGQQFFRDTILRSTIKEIPLLYLSGAEGKTRGSSGAKDAQRCRDQPILSPGRALTMTQKRYSEMGDHVYDGRLLLQSIIGKDFQRLY